MDRDNTIARLENIAKHAVHTAGEDTFILSLDDGLAIHEAIEALKAQLSQQGTTKGTTSDLISRQAAIDALHMHLMYRMGTDSNKKRLDDWINGVPSAQPERKRGEWVYNSPVTMKCNRCGLVIKDWDWHRFKICPNCGADMRGEKDERTD